MKSNFRMAAIATISALAATTMTQAASITVDPSATKQQIIGFGAGSVYYQNWINALGTTTQEALYDTAFTGLNLSLLRVGNWLQDESKGVSKDDIKIVTAGKKRLGSHMKIEMSSWSAPASLKPSGDINGKKDGVFYPGKSSTLKASSSDPYGKYAYREFASWWKRSYQAYEAAGIAPDYISFQNEPDMFAEYEETLFTPTENDTSAGYAQALRAMRDTMNTLANPPKILGPEPLGIGYTNFQKYMKALDDKNLDGYAYHLYHAGDGNDNSLANYMSPENFRSPMKAIATSYGSDARPIIMTEFCSMEENGKEEYMTGLAHIMQVGFTDGKLNGYIAWELFWGEGKGQLIGVCTKGWGSCTEDQINISPEYHAMRHYSKFVNPGWRVVSSTSEGNGLYAVAFRSADCDSITVVAINENSSSLSLNAPSVNGYNAVYAVQSVENGSKSKDIATSVSYSLPANSITTFVYTTSNTAALSCEDSPIVDPYKPADVGDTIVLIDYATTNTVSNWSGDFTVTYGTKAIDGVSSYATVPLAGCEQGSDDCSYQHAIFEVPANASDALATCSELVITMHSQDDTTTYVNVGGAGSEWISYEYGRQAGSSSWTESTVDLTNEAENGSSKITFNSNGSGVYISKIIATGCGGSSAIKNIRTNFASNMNANAKVFDLNGNLVWSGLKGQALNADGTLRLNLRQGMYLVKTKDTTAKAIKK